MYLFTNCKCPGCNKQALSNFDQNGNIVESDGYCLEHHPDPMGVLKQIRTYIKNHDKIVGLNASGINITETDLKNKKWFGCVFSHCNFSNIHAEGLHARMCILNFCTFTDCDFLNSNIQYSSFSGSKFVHVVLTGSDLIHNNFNGTTCYQSSFDNSDLYNSRFIKAILMNSSFTNCNLKKTVFFSSVREGVSFKLSNTKEALIDRSKGGMIGESTSKYDDNQGGLFL